MRSLLRVAGLVLVGVVAIAAVSVVGLFYLAQDASPQTSGALEMEGLSGTVRVSRDAFGIPHVRASSLADAFAGLGFAHAQDRLWQMDLLRRHARGRLSEVFGAATAGSDRLALTLGLGRAADAELESLPSDERTLLESYASGVNRWIEEVRRARAPLPFEWRWLGTDIADWQPADSLALLRFRAWGLSGTLSASLLLDQLKREVGSAYNHFYPTDPLELAPELVGSLEEVQRVAAAWVRGAGLAGPVGSLGIVVRGRDGLPLLANDTHLEFQLPALVYLAHLASPELELSGPTWPGIPVFWTGTNRRIAWGQVVLHASTSEIYDETLHPDDTRRYDRDGRWLEAAVREERLRVRYGGDQSFEVITTRHGPLLGSAFPADPTVHTFALGWAGDTRRSGVRGLLALQRARSWREFRRALRRYPSPAATFLYADREGQIGIQIAGRLPIRTVLMDGLLPVPGRTRMYDWRGIIPFDQLPFKFGGDLAAQVVTPQPSDLPFTHGVTWLWQRSGAGEQARAALARQDGVSLGDLVVVQRERRSAHAGETVRRLVAGAAGRSLRGARIREILLSWNGATDIESVGASVYHAFRARLTDRLLRAHLDGHLALAPRLALVEPTPGALLARFLERAHEPEATEIVDAALEDTWSWLRVHLSSNPRKWTWGELHRLKLRHPFERLGGPWLSLVGRPLARGPYPAPGDADSVWAMHQAGLPSDSSVGPVVRYVVDLADPDHAQFGLAGGQSGHPGAPHYDDALADWLAGEPRLLWMHQLDVHHQAVGVWELHPRSPSPYP